MSVPLARGGFGERRDAMPAEVAVAIKRHLLAFILMVIISISFTKLSVALFLLRIIQRRSYRRCLFVMIGESNLVAGYQLKTFTDLATRDPRHHLIYDYCCTNGPRDFDMLDDNLVFKRSFPVCTSRGSLGL